MSGNDTSNPIPLRRFTIGPGGEYDPEAQEFCSAKIKKSKTWWSGSSGTSTVVEPLSRPSPRPTLSPGSSTGDASLKRANTYRVENSDLHGYPKLSDLIGNEDNYGIYRSFASLSARNLLYHQARVTHLEHKLNELEKKYEAHTHLRYKAGHILEPQEPGTPGHTIQLVHEEVSKALDKFHHLLLVRAKVHALPRPDDNFVRSIWDITHNPKLSDPNWMQWPEDTPYAVWNDRTPVQTDLVALNSAFRQQDPFTKFFTGRLLDWWHKIYARFRKPDDGNLDEYVYGDHVISRYMRACVMIVAAALPTCAIVALYFIDSPGWRLGFIVIFSGLFASALSFFSEARNFEIFTASVALASVQVVFVGTAFGNGNGNCGT